MTPPASPCPRRATDRVVTELVGGSRRRQVADAPVQTVQTDLRLLTPPVVH